MFLILVGVVVVGAALFVFFNKAPRWKTSENGNPTRVASGKRITVFRHDEGWKYCIADATRDDDDPYFSDVYASEDDAKAQAIAHLSGQETGIKSTREVREEHSNQRTRDSANQIVAQESSKLEKIAASVQRAEFNAKVKLSTLRNIEEEVRKRIRISEHSLRTMREAGVLEFRLSPLVSAVASYRELLSKVETIIKTKDASGPAP